MKGHYDFYKDYCRCSNKLIYLGLRDLYDNEISGWPVFVYDVLLNNIGYATSKSEYISVWNSSADNREVGTLIGGMGPFGFNLSLNPGKTPPAWVIGDPDVPGVDLGIYAIQYEEAYE